MIEDVIRGKNASFFCTKIRMVFLVFSFIPIHWEAQNQSTIEKGMPRSKLEIRS
jgi:hypothetical protein